MGKIYLIREWWKRFLSTLTERCNHAVTIMEHIKDMSTLSVTELIGILEANEKKEQ